MNVQEAIMAFSQSEKIKSGIIWISQVLEMLSGLNETEKQGGIRIITAMINMLVQESRLAGKVTNDPAWEDIEKHIDKAIVMIESGVAPESISHLTQALSQVTSIGHKSMGFLKDQGLL
ncbi:MAG: hypothetical protein GY864_05020 [Desulfobacterales bacterium]|nr:hypothetical protein [Desulfobacterales bacterium]